MFRPTDDEMVFIALFLEGFLYGLYTGIFAIYLQYQVESKQNGTNKTQKILFYSTCALYVSSTSVFVCDVAFCISRSREHVVPLAWFSISPVGPILLAQIILFACCDFLAQLILIYRCWIVWGRNILIVIIPSMLALTFLVLWIVFSTPSSGDIGIDGAYPISVMGLPMSLTVNALVTGLIVFKISKVFRQVKTTSDDKVLGATGGTKLRSIIMVLIESAMALFSIQLARLVVGMAVVYKMPVYASAAFPIISAIHEMLNGITPTIILVRISMGLSFHDEKSMEEVAIGSLRFQSNHSNSIPEIGSIEISKIVQEPLRIRPESTPASLLDWRISHIITDSEPAGRIVSASPIYP